MNEHPKASDPSWFERPKNINLMIGGLVLACTALVLADLFYVNPHPHFEWESSFGFQAWFGFVSFVVIVLLGRLIRPLLSKPEDYYEHRR